MRLATPTAVFTRQQFTTGFAAALVAGFAFLAASSLDTVLSASATLWLRSLAVAPVIEELFFRGVVQSRLRARRDCWGRPLAATVVTAACFGLAHLAFSTATHSALVVIPALVIGWVWERSRSIPICIALHSAANAAWLGFWSI